MWNQVLGTRYLVRGICIVLYILYIYIYDILGICALYYAWYQVLGTKYVVPCIWYLLHVEQEST